MKKMMIALMAVLITVALAGIGTYAWFSDSKTSPDNSFTAGNVDITLGGGIADGLNFANMAPGDTVTGTMYITNTGSLPIWFSGYIASYNQNVPGFIDKFWVKVTTSDADYYAGLGGANSVIYNGWLTGLLGPQNGLISVEYPPLPSGQYAGYIFDFTLEGPNTGNEFEGAWWTGILGVRAVQSGSIGWDGAKAFLTTP